jgi:hypothetical protein
VNGARDFVSCGVCLGGFLSPFVSQWVAAPQAYSFVLNLKEDMTMMLLLFTLETLLLHIFNCRRFSLFQHFLSISLLV